MNKEDQKSLSESNTEASKIIDQIKYEHNIFSKEKVDEYRKRINSERFDRPVDNLFFFEKDLALVCLLPAPKNLSTVRVKSILGYFWEDNIFGKLITITFYLENYYQPYQRVYFFLHDKIHGALKSSHNLKLILACESGYLTICHLSLVDYFNNYLDKQNNNEGIADHFTNYNLSRFLAHCSINGSAKYYDNNPNFYLLIKSYIKRYELEAEKILWYYDQIKNLELNNLKNFLHEISNKDEVISKLKVNVIWPNVLLLYLNRTHEENTDIIALYHEIIELKDDNLSPKEESNLFALLSGIFHCHIYSPYKTSYGTMMVSHDINNNIYRQNIDYKSYKDNEICDFWTNMPWCLMPFYKEVLGGTDKPIRNNYYEYAPHWEGDIQNAESKTQALLSEAFFLKQNTIPYGAYHPLDNALGIKAIKMFEIGDEVIALLINQYGEFLMITCCPKIQAVYVRVNSEAHLWDENGDQDVASDRMNRFITGISFLIAHLIRDFWVVEDRNSIMKSRVSNRRDFSLKSDRNTKRIVYLPKIRYVGRNYDSNDLLNLVKRKPHFVTGHLRKAVNASDKQIAFAKKFSIHVPEGFTFVQPHSRGDASQEIHYKSISALKCIKAINQNDVNGDDDWFSFELNTKKWLKHNGYDVIHASASRNGDGGVDIQAFKEGEHLLVQCKYWSNRIGPDVVRELMGTLNLHPQGAKGVIVTSDQLTSGAKELAIQEGVQFVENVNFKNEFRNKL